jgi:hypothetical protein
MGNVVSSARIRFEDLRTLGFLGIGNNYAGVGLPFANPVRCLKLTNTTDADLFVSFNGIDHKDILPLKSFCLYDFGTNQSAAAGLLEQSAGDRVYVKQATATAASLGSVYVTVIYASQV